MDRCIYADDIKNAIDGVARNYLTTLSTTDAIDSVTAKWLYKRLRTLVDEMPTADVVEVVRCKDCKYMPTGDGANHDLEFPEDFKCPCQCDDFWYSWKPDDNWFCGNGERRDDG